MGEAQGAGMLAIVVKDNFFFKDILCSNMFRNFMVKVYYRIFWNFQYATDIFITNFLLEV